MDDGTSQQQCCLCGFKEDDQLKFGQLFILEDFAVHHFCMLFSPNLAQNGKDDEGAEGFLPADIKSEVARCSSIICCYCQKGGASGFCMSTKCNRHYHVGCAIQADGLLQFFGKFRSFCVDHRPRQNVLGRESGESCGICLERTDPEDGHHVLWTPCCRHFFHRPCLQRMAYHFGYFFYCPGCRNKDNISGFLKHMRHFGIFVPKRDASWEMVPNAFDELLERNVLCDVRYCLCNKGRTYKEDHDSPWRLCVCDTCGSAGTHQACSDLAPDVAGWVCEACSLEPSPPAGSRKLTLRDFLEQRVALSAASKSQGGEGSSRGPVLPGTLELHEVLSELDRPEELVRFSVSPNVGLSIQTRPVSDVRRATRESGSRPVTFSPHLLLPEVVISQQDLDRAEGRLQADQRRVAAEKPGRATDAACRPVPMADSPGHDRPSKAASQAHHARRSGLGSTNYQQVTGGPSRTSHQHVAAIGTERATGQRKRPLDPSRVNDQHETPRGSRRSSDKHVSSRVSRRASGRYEVRLGPRRTIGRHDTPGSSTTDDQDGTRPILSRVSNQDEVPRGPTRTTDQHETPRGPSRTSGRRTPSDGPRGGTSVVPVGRATPAGPESRSERRLAGGGGGRQTGGRRLQETADQSGGGGGRRADGRRLQETADQSGGGGRLETGGRRLQETADQDGGGGAAADARPPQPGDSGAVSAAAAAAPGPVAGLAGSAQRTAGSGQQPSGSSGAGETSTEAQLKLVHRARAALNTNPCPVCDKEYQTLRQVTLHYYTHHEQAFLFRCKLCDAKFSHWQPRHMLTAHAHLRFDKAISYMENKFRDGQRYVADLILRRSGIIVGSLIEQVLINPSNQMIVRLPTTPGKTATPTSSLLDTLPKARAAETTAKHAEKLKPEKLTALKALRMGESQTNLHSTGASSSGVAAERDAAEETESDRPAGRPEAAACSRRPADVSEAPAAAADQSRQVVTMERCPRCNFRGIAAALARHSVWHSPAAATRRKQLRHHCPRCFYGSDARAHMQAHMRYVHFLESDHVSDSQEGRMSGKHQKPVNEQDDDQDPDGGLDRTCTMRHRRECGKFVRYDCPYCDSFFSERPAYRLHFQQWHHGATTSPVCNLPNCFAFPASDHGRWYHKSATVRNWPCADCGGTVFSGREARHGDGGCRNGTRHLFECPMPICGFDAAQQDAVDAHVIECHSLWIRGTSGPRSAPYRCPDCDADLPYDDLWRHLADHASRPAADASPAEDGGSDATELRQQAAGRAGGHETRVGAESEPGFTCLRSKSRAGGAGPAETEAAVSAPPATDGPDRISENRTLSEANDGVCWTQLTLGRFMGVVDPKMADETVDMESERNGSGQGKKGNYQCVFCAVKCKSSNAVDKHSRMAHSVEVRSFNMFVKSCKDKNASIRCPFCDVAVGVKWRFFQHVVAHRINVPLHCVTRSPTGEVPAQARAKIGSDVTAASAQSPANHPQPSAAELWDRPGVAGPERSTGVVHQCMKCLMKLPTVAALESHVLRHAKKRKQHLLSEYGQKRFAGSPS